MESWFLWILFDKQGPFFLANYPIRHFFDDKTFYGSIKIMSEALVMINMSDSMDKDIFVSMTQLADDVFISSENGLAILTCTFSLYDRVKISNKTDELNQIKNNIALLRSKKGKKRILDLD